MKQNLNDNWKLCYRPLGWGVGDAARVRFVEAGGAKSRNSAAENTADYDSPTFDVALPCDVHQPLIRDGVIKEPVEGVNSFDCEWMEEKSWWFTREIELAAEDLSADKLELTFESIDLAADLFVNGAHIAHHESAHYPLVADIRHVAVAGANTILLRVTSGAESVNRELVYDLGRSVNKTYRRGDERRVYLRKPQYVYGWDWGPRIVTCGIMKDVYLRRLKTVACRDTKLVTTTINGTSGAAQVEATVTVENFHIYSTREATVTVEFSYEDETAVRTETPVQLCAGINYVKVPTTIENPHLWWPRGMGPQSLYTVRTSVEVDGLVHEGEPVEFGIRTLVINQSPIESAGDGETDSAAAGSQITAAATVENAGNPGPLANAGHSGGRLFAVEVNGKHVFCRGGDWIPADSIYARVTDEKYEALVDAAADANFTMLRIWGGGIYERDVFYSQCNRKGILVWHDFMFACALYPDRDSAFVELCRREIEYQTVRLRNHPSIALFCGSNENHWIYQNGWSKMYDPEYFGGGYIYNYLAPSIMAANCPHIPYWNSSPYGGEEPNSTQVGNRHHWHDAMMNPEMEKRITPEGYDGIGSRFVTEYGYIGPCSMKTIERYHGGEPIERESEIWNWHNNTFEKETVVAGIKKHYVDPEGLSLEEYLLYAGLGQSLMLGYSLEALRYTRVTNGSLFWMYADCWGEVGWTIVDYYLDRKPAFYAVKRAFAPRRLILRREGEKLGVLLANDTAEDLSLDAEVGFLSFDGSVRDVDSVTIEAPAFTRRWSQFDVDLSRGTGRDAEGLIVVVPKQSAHAAASTGTKGSAHTVGGSAATVLPGILRPGPFRDLKAPRANVEITVEPAPSDESSANAALRAKAGANETAVLCRVGSATYAHAVHFALPDGAVPEDDYFDLLPGEERLIRVRGVSGGEAISATAVQ